MGNVIKIILVYTYCLTWSISNFFELLLFFVQFSVIYLAGGVENIIFDLII